MKKIADERLEKLFAGARENTFDTSAAEYNFETRLMAKIAELREQNNSWFNAIWRMIPAFAVLTAVIAACCITFTETHSDAMFSALTTGQEEQVSMNTLTGE